MAELLWICMLLFMIPKLQVTATLERYSYMTVRPGSDATLPCYNVQRNQDKCGKTGWIFKKIPQNNISLVTMGKIAADKTDRLNLTTVCALTIKNVTEKDAGVYSCTQDARETGLVYLSIVKMTEHKTGDNVTVTCSVLAFGDCEHKVKWLHPKVPELNTLPCGRYCCSATVSFLASRFVDTSSLNSLQCEVDRSNVLEYFPYRPQASDGKIAWWWFLVVGLVALVVIVFVVRRYKTRKGKKTQENNAGADADAGAEAEQSYASITFIKKSSSKAPVPTKTDDGEVIYSTMAGSAAGAAVSAQV